MTPDIYRIKGIEPLQLAVMPRPRGGDSLANEIQGLFRSGISTIVSMLEQQEARELELGNEEALCHDYGISFISFPVRDRGVPLTFQSLDALVAVIIEQLKAKRQVAIHCRAGIGRSGLLAGCVLTSLGISPAEALRLVSSARRVRVPDTEEQERWVAAYARQNAVQRCASRDGFAARE